MRKINDSLGLLSAALATGSIVAQNEPQKLPVHQPVPPPPLRRSIRERILLAQDVQTVDQLLSEALRYRKISPRTLRQIELAADTRKTQLGGSR